MKAAIITIGDEILIGQIVDTNSGYIAKALDRIGIEIKEMLSISDDKQAILDAFLYLQNNVDIVVITGGLGPTKDDITKKTICDYFNDELVRDSAVEAHVIALIEKALQRKASQMNIDQALFLQSVQFCIMKLVLRQECGLKKNKRSLFLCQEFLMK